jgi:SDR family mycofactocin-dependent oxidoreductase
MPLLDGKVALVTGAARGQGRAQALRLAESGAGVIAVDIASTIDSVPYGLASADDLYETASLVEAQGAAAFAVHADVRDASALADAVARGVGEIGRLDIVVASAGIWSAAPFLEMSEQTYRDVIDVQLHGSWNTCRATLPYLVEQGEGGSIVLINSTAGFTGFPNQAHYNVAKHGCIGLMRSLANEFAECFIRVNCVHPGSVATPMIDNPDLWRTIAAGAADPTLEDFAAAFRAMNLLPVPWVDPVDVANAVVWLASDEARYVTGVCLPVDAGFLASAYRSVSG